MATATPAEKPLTDIEDMSEAAHSSIIEIKSNIDLQGHAADLFEQSQTLFSTEFLVQFGAIIFSIGLALALAHSWRKKFRAYIEGLDIKTTRKISENIIDGLPRIVLPAMASLFLYIFSKVAQWSDFNVDMLNIATSMSFAWLVVSYASSFIQSRVIAKWVATVVLVMIGLRIVGWWDISLDILNSISFGLGESRISLLALIKGVCYFIFFLWMAATFSSALEKQIKSLEGLTPSLKVLFSKLLKITFVFVAFLFGLNSIGVDLTSFAIFGGAIGVGLGFGLQKVVSNFISGIILLLDRSIKPGDVIAVGGDGGAVTFGWVNTLGARYVSIIRRDGKEHLIPNELLITEKVENWSFSNNDIRLHISVGVSYNADVHKALALCLEAAEEEGRIKKFPEPVVRVTGFGDSSVDLEIRGWINDPVNGLGNIKSAVLLKVWDKFQEHDVEIPYPQRDLHLKSMPDGMLRGIKEELKAELIEELKGKA